ncbi:MAG: hypothetical protein WA633_11280 [Stellaceae bacterium]
MAGWARGGSLSRRAHGQLVIAAPGEREQGLELQDIRGLFSEADRPFLEY